MIYLHKILPFVLSPLVIAMGLILYGLLSKKGRYGLFGLFVLYSASTFFVADFLFERLEGKGRDIQVDAVGQADGIVVLSGMMMGVRGSTGPMQEWDDADRFFAGVDLYQAGKSPRLIFTGGRLPWERAELSEGAMLKQYAERLGVPARAISVSAEAYNTEEEARVVKRLFEQSQPRILLVTSAYHMPRAQALFEREGFKVEAFPVDFKVRAKALTPMDFMPDPRALRMTDVLVREYLGRFYYWVRAFTKSFQSP